MRSFKFFQKNETRRTSVHRRLLGIPIGSIRWVDLPTVRINYMDGDDNWNDQVNLTFGSMSVSMELITLVSYNDFCEMNRGNTILIYNIGDPLTGMVYTEENFNEMPRDRALILRGKVLNNDLTNIGIIL